jgi:hypothetical protein
VIPPDWTPVHRPSDGEAVGYLAFDPAGALPVSLCGLPLGRAQDAAAAEDVLVHNGLAALDRRFWCALPDPLPAGEFDAVGAGGTDWRPVVIIEVSADRTVVRPEWPAPEELTARAVLPTPVGDLLRSEMPT